MALGVIETYVEKEPNGTAGEALEILLPALVEGAIERPGDTDIYKFKVSDGQSLAFEIETPGSSIQLFMFLFPAREVLAWCLLCKG